MRRAALLCAALALAGCGHLVILNDPLTAAEIKALNPLRGTGASPIMRQLSTDR